MAVLVIIFTLSLFYPAITAGPQSHGHAHIHQELPNYECYQWTNADRQIIGNYPTPEQKTKRCVDLGYQSTQGKNGGLYAGCRLCSCCKPAAKREDWNITIVLRSGRDDNPSWLITENDRKIRIVEKIVKALDWYAHNRPNGKLKATSGYQGFAMTHIINGVEVDNNELPACGLKQLERAIVTYTSRNAMTPYHKKMVLCILDNCGKNIPSRCYERPKSPTKP